MSASYLGRIDTCSCLPRNPVTQHRLAHERLLLPSRDAIKGSGCRDDCDRSRDTELEGGLVVECLPLAVDEGLDLLPATKQTE